MITNGLPKILTLNKKGTKIREKNSFAYSSMTRVARSWRLCVSHPTIASYMWLNFHQNISTSSRVIEMSH
jgi:hypothetical protein